MFSETKNNRLIQKDFIVCQIQLKLLYQICVFYNDHQNWGNHKKKLHGLKPEINKNITFIKTSSFSNKLTTVNKENLFKHTHKHKSNARSES